MAAPPVPNAPLDRDPPDPGNAWAERIRAGDESAYREIFDRLYAPLIAYTARIVNSTPVAEELIQDLFLTLWRRREELADVAQSITAYLFVSAKNRALVHVRRERLERRWRDHEVLAERSTRGRHVRDAHSELAEAELLIAISDAVASMPDRMRQVFIMSRQRGLRYNEIASELGLSPKTVDNHIRAALKVLRTKLEPFLK